MSLMVVALDPGMNSPGIAIFRDSVLLRGARFDTSEYAGMPDGQRWLRVARTLLGLVLKYSGPPVDDPLTVVFEKPQWDARSKKVDPNDLVSIAGVAANLTGLLSSRFHVDVGSPTPSEWIGQLSKKCPACTSTRRMRKGTGVKTFARHCAECHGSAWETPRGRYIRKRLSEAELALVPDQNDAIDAVGLGLWALGRLKPHSSFSNGRDGR